MSEAKPEAKPEEIKDLKFSFKPAKEKPKRAYRKGSKYDPVIDGFLASKEKMSVLTIEGYNANYLRTQINKRIEARNLKTITVSVVNNQCYLERK